MNLLEAVIQLRRTVSRAGLVMTAGELSSRQGIVLREIGASGPVSQIALARATASDPSYIVRLLDDLEKRGFVKRQRSESDRREMAVSVTPKGRKALGSVEEAFSRLNAALEQGLSVDEKATFVRLAAKMQRSLAAATRADGSSAEDAREQR